MAICTIILTEKESKRICISNEKNTQFYKKFHLVSCFTFDDELKVFPVNCKTEGKKEGKEEDAAKRKKYSFNFNLNASPLFAH